MLDSLLKDSFFYEMNVVCILFIMAQRQSIIITSDNHLVRTREKCIVCFEDMNLSSVILDCGHVFHRRCILKWARISPTCPICRESLQSCLLEIIVVEDARRRLHRRLESNARSMNADRSCDRLISWTCMGVGLAIIASSLIASFIIDSMEN